MSYMHQDQSVPWIDANIINGSNIKRSSHGFKTILFGQGQHPANRIKELYSLCGRANKCQIDILSYFDGWHRSKGVETWILTSYTKIATATHYSRQTIAKQTKALVELGYLEQRELKPEEKFWSGDPRKGYRLCCPEILSAMGHSPLRGNNPPPPVKLLTPAVKDLTHYNSNEVNLDNVCEEQHIKLGGILSQSNSVLGDDSSEFCQEPNNSQEKQTELKSAVEDLNSAGDLAPRPKPKLKDEQQQSQDSLTPEEFQRFEAQLAPLNISLQNADSGLIWHLKRFWRNLKDAVDATLQAIDQNRCSCVVAFLKKALSQGFKPYAQAAGAAPPTATPKQKQRKPQQSQDSETRPVPDKIELPALGAEMQQSEIIKRPERPPTPRPKYLFPAGDWLNQQGQLRRDFVEWKAKLWQKSPNASFKDMHTEEVIGMVLNHFSRHPENLAIDWETYARTCATRAETIHLRRQAGVRVTLEEERRLISEAEAIRSAYENQEPAVEPHCSRLPSLEPAANLSKPPQLSPDSTADTAVDVESQELPNAQPRSGFIDELLPPAFRSRRNAAGETEAKQKAAKEKVKRMTGRW